MPSRQASLHHASPRLPAEEWLHEIKHDGFRIIARKDAKRVKLYSRPGNDLTGPQVVAVELEQVERIETIAPLANRELTARPLV